MSSSNFDVLFELLSQLQILLDDLVIPLEFSESLSISVRVHSWSHPTVDRFGATGDGSVSMQSK